MKLSVGKCEDGCVILKVEEIKIDTVEKSDGHDIHLDPDHARDLGNVLIALADEQMEEHPDIPQGHKVLM